MASPVIQSIQYTGTTLRIIFDVAVTATGGSELNGFTFTITPGPSVISPTFSAFDENAIVCTLASPVGAGETLTVDYVSGSGTVVDAATSTDPALTFNKAAVAAPTVGDTSHAVTGSGTGQNDDITVFFTEAVASPTGDLLAGFSVTLDGQPVALGTATASLNANQTQLTISTGTNFPYTGAIEIVYDSGTGDLYTWPGGAVDDFTLSVYNLSTDGLPDSDYPLSTALGEELEIAGNVVTGRITLSLNPVDIELAGRYGPATVITGGTFGTAPNEITIVGRTSSLVDGAVISESFTDASSVANAAAAALDWRTDVLGRIGVALGELRTIDQGVSLGSRVVGQV